MKTRVALFAGLLATVAVAQQPAVPARVAARATTKLGQARDFAGRLTTTSTVTLAISARAGQAGPFTAEWYIVGRNLRLPKSGMEKPAPRLVADWGRIELALTPGEDRAETVVSRAISPALDGDAATVEGWIVRLLSADGRVVATAVSSDHLRPLVESTARWDEFLYARSQPQGATWKTKPVRK